VKESKPQRSSEKAIANAVGDLVALGPLRRDLIPTYQRWVNDFGTMRAIGLPLRPVTTEQEEDCYESQAKAEQEATFTVYERYSLRPIGTASSHAIDHRNRTAIFGIMIGEPADRGKGYGAETTRLVLDYSFVDLVPHNVALTVFEYNPAGLRAYAKAGFEEFGRRRECRTMGGRLWDEIHMQCLSTRFESPVPGRIFAPSEVRS
jgi:RimJ/RimL family protein N-acetyltransferase